MAVSVFKGNIQLPNDSKQNAVMNNGHVIIFSADCDSIRELLILTSSHCFFGFYFSGLNGSVAFKHYYP